MTDQASITALVVVLFLTIFPAFWCLIVLLLSWVGGWRRLAGTYATDKEPRGKEFRGITGAVGTVSYKHCLIAHAAADGLFLTLPIFFRIGHKPLLIPWTAIHSLKPFKVFWHQAVRFDVGMPSIATLRLPPEVLQAGGKTVSG